MKPGEAFPVALGRESVGHATSGGPGTEPPLPERSADRSGRTAHLTGGRTALSSGGVPGCASLVQHGGATLADTYQALTGQTNGFWAFKWLLSEHFPIGVQSPTDDPFPLSPVLVSTAVAPGAASSGNTTALVVTGTDGRVLYECWDLGQGGLGFVELAGPWRTDAAPAAALVSQQHDYLFVVVKGLDGNLYLDQGQMGDPFVGWGQVDFQTNLAPGATSSGDTAAVVAVAADGRIFYDWWQLGQGGHGFVELVGEVRTDAAPAAALVGQQHDYLFVVVKGLDGNLYLNQGQLGGPFVGWQ